MRVSYVQFSSRFLVGGCTRTSMLAKLTSITCFVIASCTMMPLNKVVMRRLHHTPFTAVAGQMLGGALLLAFGSHRMSSGVYRCLVLPPLFTMMIVTSMFSLHYASLGAIMAIRNTAPLICLPLENLFVTPRPIDGKTATSLALVLAGCVGYVWNDLHTSMLGVALIGVNTIASVFDRLVQRSLLSETDISKATILLVNNLVGGCIVAGLAYVAEEDSIGAMQKEEARVPWVASILVGLCLGYSGVWAQSHVNATTHLLLSNLNRIVVLLVGSIVLGETVQWVQWLSAVTSVVGTIMYSLD